jgi:hypothetical protein
MKYAIASPPAALRVQFGQVLKIVWRRGRAAVIDDKGQIVEHQLGDLAGRQQACGLQRERDAGRVAHQGA